GEPLARLRVREVDRDAAVLRRHRLQLEDVLLGDLGLRRGEVLGAERGAVTLREAARLVAGTELLETLADPVSPAPDDPPDDLLELVGLDGLHLLRRRRDVEVQTGLVAATEREVVVQDRALEAFDERPLDRLPDLAREAVLRQ